MSYRFCVLHGLAEFLLRIDGNSRQSFYQRLFYSSNLSAFRGCGVWSSIFRVLYCMHLVVTLPAWVAGLVPHLLRSRGFLHGLRYDLAT